MGKIMLIVVFLFGSFLVSVSANEKKPDFGEYSVKDFYEGLVHVPEFRKGDNYYRTIIWGTSHLSPNFAGHYIVTTFGCGTECVRGFIYDAKTGYITWFPYYIASANSDYFEPLEFKIDSSLIMFRGRPDEERPNGEYYYNFKDEKLIPVATIPLPDDYKGEEMP